MSNTLLTSTLVANEALRLLMNRLGVLKAVWRGVEPDIAGKRVGDTINIRSRGSFTAKNFSGTISKQDVTETAVPLVLDHFLDVSAEFTAKERALSIENYSEQFLKPAIYSLANELEREILGIAYANATLSATKASTAVLTDLGTAALQFENAAVPADDRHFFFSPTHYYAYLALDNFAKVAYSGTDEGLRGGKLGSVFGFDTYMSQNCPTIASSTGSATAYKVAGTIGELAVAITELSSATHTVKTGDGFVVDNHVYHFTADGTGTTSAIASIAIDRPLHKTLTATSVVLLTNASIAFHRSGIAVAFAPLSIPSGVDSYVATDPESGISVRVTSAYDIDTKKEIISVDLLAGIKATAGARIMKFTNA